MRILLAILLIWFGCAPAFSMAAGCVPRDKIVKYLAKKYHEKPFGFGTPSDGKRVYEFLMSRDGKTFTILMTNQNKVSCMMGFGRDLEIKLPVGDEDA